MENELGYYTKWGLVADVVEVTSLVIAQSLPKNWVNFFEQKHRMKQICLILCNIFLNYLVILRISGLDFELDNCKLLISIKTVTK